jgi:predicted MFS family arabinose efflux permease
VSLLTGSKNALKGGGFFAGAALLELAGFRGALTVLAALLFVVLVVTALLLPSGLGKMKAKPKFSQVFSPLPAINTLSAARFFLFGARDIWFVVALPVYLYSTLGWDFTAVGGFFALWVIGYGVVQASAPRLVSRSHHGVGPGGDSARRWALLLALSPAAIAIALQQGWAVETVVVMGLALFGILFAINSAVHSYLILAYAEHDRVAMNVGFYYMANAGGRLTGTVLSGWLYQQYGLVGCLWASTLFVLASAILAWGLPRPAQAVEGQ